MVEISEELVAGRRGWNVGLVLVDGVVQRAGAPEVEAALARLEESAAERWRGKDRKALAAIEPFKDYQDYYDLRGKTYPVLIQAESVATKGRPVAIADPLVRAMFAIEIKNAILTAGHDYERIKPPLRLGLAGGTERYALLGGREKVAFAGDFAMSDSGGLIASVILGPDERTRLSSATTRLLFVSYAPPSVSRNELYAHLAELARAVGLVSPGCEAREPELLTPV